MSVRILGHNKSLQPTRTSTPTPDQITSLSSQAILQQFNRAARCHSKKKREQLLRRRVLDHFREVDQQLQGKRRLTSESTPNAATNNCDPNSTSLQEDAPALSSARKVIPFTNRKRSTDLHSVSASVCTSTRNIQRVTANKSTQSDQQAVGLVKTSGTNTRTETTIKSSTSTTKRRITATKEKLPVKMTRLQTRREEGKLKQMEELEAIKLVEEQCIANKKKNSDARKLQEEEAKRKKDEEKRKKEEEEEIKKAEVAAVAAIAGQEKEDEKLDEEPVGNLNQNLHDILNRVTDNLDAWENDAIEDQQEDRSPKMKRNGSSKSSSRRYPTKITPSEMRTADSTKKKISFEDTYVHPHKRVIIELAILLKSDNASEEFTKALMAFLENAQMVDPKFEINTLKPTSKEKSIKNKGEISPNMTKLGIHIKVSGNGNVFNKQKVWDYQGQGNNGRSSRKSNKKEEYKDPTVYFSMVVSSEVEPVEIIERVTHEWARLNGTRLQVKDLQFVDSETVVSIFKISTATNKDVIREELKRILLNAQSKAQSEYMDPEKFNFSMDMDVAIGESLPVFDLKIQNAKLKGQDVAIFNKLSNRAQFARKSVHVEVASKYADGMKELVQYAKESGCVAQLWGRHAHLSKITDQKSTSREAKRQVDVAQAHTNYQMSMISEELDGLVCLDETADIMHEVSGTKISTLSLRFVLLNYLQMTDGHPTIAEVHQASIMMPTYVVIPNTPEAERMLLMMNKNSRRQLPLLIWMQKTVWG